jgi:predicted acyltransferase
LGLNILSQLHYLDFLHPIRPIFGVIISGNVPSIVLSGLLIGIILKRYQENKFQFLRIIIPIGILSIFTGFMLRNWFIISKIKATPSWSMICVGISILFLAFLYFIIEYKQSGKWLNVFKPAGENSLTTYLTPDIFYHLIWYLGLPFFFYKQDYSQTLAVFGSIAWASVMIWLCN